MTGKMIIFSAPSGSGKTTILKEVMKTRNDFAFSISACSRESRGSEVHGEDYYFLSVEDFKNKIAANAFVEWEEVYENRFYGTLKTEVERIWDNKEIVLFDVDVVGGLNIKKMYADQALALFIQPPSLEILKERLIGRDTDNEEDIKLRLDKAEEELSYASEFDHIIINDQLDVAVKKTIALIESFINDKK